MPRLIYAFSLPLASLPSPHLDGVLENSRGLAILLSGLFHSFVERMTKCGTFPVATTRCSGEDEPTRVFSPAATRFGPACWGKVLRRIHQRSESDRRVSDAPSSEVWVFSSGRDPLIPSRLASSRSPLPGKVRVGSGRCWASGDGCLRSIPGDLPPWGCTPFRRFGVGRTGSVPTEAGIACPPTIGSPPRGAGPGMRGRH